MPYKRGAPLGNKNRLKHGRYTAESLAFRRRVVETLRETRRLLAVARVASPRRAKSMVDKST